MTEGASSKQPMTIPNSGNSPLDLADTHVNVLGAPANVKALIVDGEILLATDKVRP